MGLYGAKLEGKKVKITPYACLNPPALRGPADQEHGCPLCLERNGQICLDQAKHIGCCLVLKALPGSHPWDSLAALGESHKARLGAARRSWHIPSLLTLWMWHFVFVMGRRWGPHSLPPGAADLGESLSTWPQVQPCRGNQR